MIDWWIINWWWKNFAGKYGISETFPCARVNHSWEHEIMIFCPFDDCNSFWLIITSSVMIKGDRDVNFWTTSTFFVSHYLIGQKWEISIQINFPLIISSKNPSNFFIIDTWILSLDISIRIKAKLIYVK